MILVCIMLFLVSENPGVVFVMYLLSDVIEPTGRQHPLIWSQKGSMNMMQALDKDKVISLLNRTLELEGAGAARRMAPGQIQTTREDA